VIIPDRRSLVKHTKITGSRNVLDLVGDLMIFSPSLKQLAKYRGLILVLIDSAETLKAVKEDWL
jgi:hypothetical protein